MKKISLLIIVASILVLPGCGSRFSIVRNEVTKDYFQQTYGKHTRSGAYFVSRREFLYIMASYKRSILENDLLSDSKKEKITEQINSLKYVNKQYALFFVRVYNNPLLRKHTKFKFSLIDKKNQSVVDRILYMPMKIVTYYEGGGKIISYSYIWMIKTVAPVNSDNYKENQLPLQLITEYPNKQVTVYNVD
ncbi:hypothetical protein ACFL20_10715 [Spirochaetota bacterium]